MKIVSGRYGGRKLISPQDDRVRPTSDKVRGAVFNMLQARSVIIDAYVLDAFCGSGALGLEALSRGADFCRFVDNDVTSLDLAKMNARNLHCTDFCDFVKADALKQRSSSYAYSLVFLDPPYNQGLVSAMLRGLIEYSLLCDRAWVVCETERGMDLDISGYTLDGDKTYGSVQVRLLQYSS